MALTHAIKVRIWLILGLIVLIWVASFGFFFLHVGPPPGIVPRQTEGLLGIVLAPFIHGNLPHLFANTAGLASLAWPIAWRGKMYFFSTTLLIILIGGLAVWLFARPVIHIGASGLVFGYFGFLIGRVFFERSFRALLFGGFVVSLYGGMFWGIFPGLPGISWESHLFGMLAGIATSFLMAKVPGKPLV